MPTSARIGGVRITHPDRVLDPALGVRKRDVAAYFAAVARWMLPHVRHRPLTLVRCPEGPDEGCFYQRHASPGLPPEVDRVSVRDDDGPTELLAVRRRPALVALAQVGTLEVHTWLARIDRPERPDRVGFDLDPGPDVPWEAVVDAAFRVRARLEAEGVRAWVKTTGGRGLHVVVPIVRRASFDAVRGWARRIAVALVAAHPDRFTLEARKEARPRRIYLDVLRNAYAASMVAPYSPRARPGLPVSVPVAWDELADGVDPAAWTIATVPDRLRERGDPWAALLRGAQRLPLSESS